MAAKARRHPPAASARPTGLRPRLKVWVVVDDRVKFGDGRASLLDAIIELGSLQRAVARFGMSYRGAWGYFRELERATGFPLLERHPGGGSTGGTRLTPEGRRFLERYRRFREAVVEGHFRRSFR